MRAMSLVRAFYPIQTLRLASARWSAFAANARFREQSARASTYIYDRRTHSDLRSRRDGTECEHRCGF
jgi:hypothetical protein